MQRRVTFALWILCLTTSQPMRQLSTERHALIYLPSFVWENTRQNSASELKSINQGKASPNPFTVSLSDHRSASTVKGKGVCPWVQEISL
ncbi:hypothetical protein BD324DRAFT_611518 [Kockovaella imperatae]|uniref:Secreted protein n=1 Tax=Kockovaella imperatae TaxID=4999 RepID=A0A1Y1URB5_9TREE|nr:hypothetical protein BD324DRAFT_611518 [Kockovaella imperatae]ORX40613.1 hypothetical protein BD324DRAFT_611518 [Kockovaella imperatae]